jgi:hypothetical protein
MDAPSASAGKTALINPVTGAVRLGSGTVAANYGSSSDEVACPGKTTCLAEAIGGNEGDIAEIVAISTKTGAQKVTAKLPTTAQYYLNYLTCPSSAYCYALGFTAPNGVQLPTWALLMKVSPTGAILSKSVDKSYYSYGPIACESSSFCLVGLETKKFGFQVMPLVNGKFGKEQALPSSFWPSSIECYSDKLCYAAGDTTGGTSATPELVPLNPKTGAPGKLLKLPITAGGTLTASAPLGLACYSGSQCVVVSDILKGTSSNSYTEAVYVVINRGKAGEVVVASTEHNSAFYAVSCASAKECYAVGTYYAANSNYEPTIVDKV